MKTGVLMGMLSLSLAGFGQGAEGINRITNSADQFTISLPEGWKVIPKDIMENHLKAIKSLSPGVSEQDFQHGYQLSSNADWFSYPYILIQMNKKRRIPESSLRKMDQLDKVMKRDLKKAEKSLESLLSETAMDRPIYEPGAHIMWLAASMTVTGIGKVKMMAGVHLTEQGSINVYTYSRESEFKAAAPVLEAVIRSVEPGEAIKYKSDSWQVSSIWKGAILGAGFGALVGLILWVAGRRKVPGEENTEK